MATVGELAINITGHNAPLFAALNGASAALRGFGAAAAVEGTGAAAGLARVGVAATAMAATTALAAAASVNAAADFQDRLAIINTIAHQTPDELNRTGAAIRAMAVESGESLADLSGAFYDLLSAGVAPAQAMDVLRSATTLAIGGLATTKQTVDLLTTAMNAYGLTTAQVAGATDQFALAVQDGKVTADAIAATFGDVAPIAKTAGIGIDEIAAAYAVMTSRGVPAAEVTTQMNRAIQELLKPHAALNALQKETGLNFAQIASDQGLVVALQAMRDAAEANDVPFQNLFGRQEAFKFALATTGPEVARYASELVAMHNATGTASAQAEERMDTFNRQAAILSNSIQDLAIGVGNAFLPQLTSFVQGVSDAVQGVAAWSAANPALAGTILAVASGVSALVAGVIFLGPILGAIGGALGILLNPVLLVGAAVGGLAAHFGLLGEGPKGFIDGLAASLSGLLPATGPVRDAVNLIGGAINTIPGIVSAAQGAIGDFVSTLQALWASISPDVIAAVGGAFNTISGAVNAAAGAFGPLIGQFVNFVTSAGFVRGVTDAIGIGLGILRGAFDAVVAVVSTVVGWISTFVTHLLGARDTAAGARGVFDVLAGVLGLVRDVFGNIVGVISTVVTAIASAIDRTGALNVIFSILRGTADIINAVFGLLGDAFHRAFEVAGQVAGVVSGALSTAFNVIKGVIDAVTGVVKGLIDALQKAIDLAGKAAEAVTGKGGVHLDQTGHDPVGDFIRNFKLPEFATGGIVPGAGPQLVIAHGGETITPTGQPGTAPTGGTQSLTTHVHVHLDGREIAEIIDQRLFGTASVFNSGFVSNGAEP